MRGISWPLAANHPANLWTPMLDPRIYRTGLVAAVLAVIVFAFALQGQPGPLGTSLAPDAFNGQTAYSDTVALAGQFPHRPPGSAQDAAFASLVAARLSGDGYRVHEQRFSAVTPAGRRMTSNVIAVQPGLSNDAILVLAHRDALRSPALAEDSGTAVLLELARVLAGETLNHTVVIASTSGSAGAAGAAQLATGLGRPIDAVIVLGDMAGVELRRPLVVPWSNTSQLAPTVLRNTIASALRSQAGLSPGSPSLFGEIAHLAFPLSLTEQAAFDARGIPAVLISASGARLVPPSEAISSVRVARLGRAALEAVNAVDGGPPIPAPSTYLSFDGKLVPKWAVELLVLALILPAAATALDGLARARRRGYVLGRRLLWICVCTLPFIAALLIVRALGATGLVNAPAGTVGPGTFPPGAGGIAVLACLAALIVASFVWLYLCGGLRALVGREGARTQVPDGTSNSNGRRAPLGDPGAVAATLISLSALAIAVWAVNPFAAFLLVPALHLWMVALAPVRRIGRALRVASLALGFALPALVIVYYLHTLGFSPVELAWTGALMVAGGQLGIPAGAVVCLLLGVAVSALANAVEILRVKVRYEPPATPITVRGPLTYAGPGSLGGTESAFSRTGSAPRR